MLKLKKNRLVFIKLGGSAITYKNIPYKANFKVLKQVSKEISKIYKEKKLLIGHGSGSFGHRAALKYNLKQGLKSCGIKGFSEIHKAAHSLNVIVVSSLLEEGITAIPVQACVFTTMRNGKIKTMHTKAIENILQTNIIPVIYGDIIYDETKGCSIASTEMLLAYIAKKLKPKKIIIGTNVDGVLSKNGKLIPEINKKNFTSVLKQIKSPKKNDVTGGMRHKIEELAPLSRNAETRIINLLKKNNLKRAVLGEKLGTRIKL